MVKLFPNIKAPVNSGRNDIRFINIYVDNINNLYFDYILKKTQARRYKYPYIASPHFYSRNICCITNDNDG